MNELVQLCKDWAQLPGLREAMIATAPRRRCWYHRFGPRRHDLARIAAVVHALCGRDDHPVASWVHQHRSDRPLFFDGSPMRDSDYPRHLRQIAPRACHYHNVFFFIGGGSRSVDSQDVNGPRRAVRPGVAKARTRRDGSLRDRFPRPT